MSDFSSIQSSETKMSQHGPNYAKNRKKRIKKKAKKKAATVSEPITQTTNEGHENNKALSPLINKVLLAKNENSSSPATHTENKNKNNTKSLLTASIEKAMIESNNNTTFVKQHIDDTGEASVMPTNMAEKDLTKTQSKLLKLSENVQYCIRSVIAFRTIDIENIIRQIVKNNKTNKEYRSTDNSAAITVTKNVHDLTEKHTPHAFSDNIKHGINCAVASRVVNLENIIQKIIENNAKETEPNTLNKTDTGGDSSFKDNSGNVIKTHNKESSSVTGTAKSIGQTTTSPPTTKLSENIQYCIQSVIRSRSIDIYKIIYLSHDTKAKKVGSASRGPIAPSSSTKPARANNKKDQAREYGRFNLFNKKKRCIIL
ncbi:uncharacterized protein BX663DRAFT_329286 [Cokeromyces recurvatus]|uniref:uncharacterized protein n=1 Tax=Cokeromyces recurvatus TaxID=90255 RepID=UPI00221FD449|nr:uncharacterized protein BX663DRAFT_329286 [Cokeromyces recurvatus]KAI7904822.1 hypothetical protein BX663DRAFT_329286 [Cokeromyces recurvatus]